MQAKRRDESEEVVTDEVVLKAASGDESAFAIIFQRYYADTVGMARSVVRRNEDAEEIAQQAWIKIWNRLSGFSGRSSLSTWLYRVVVNTAKDYLDKQKRRSAISIDGAEEQEYAIQIPDRNGTPMDSLVCKEWGKIVDHALAEMPAECRTAFCLRVYEGLSYKEIAGIMNTSVNTVGVRIFTARSRIVAQSEAGTSLSCALFTSGIEGNGLLPIHVC